MIQNISRLISGQVSKNNRAKFFCRRCLNHFSSSEKLEIHLESCEQFEFVKIEMPEEGTKLRFKNFQREMKIPFVVYADFECIVEKVSSASKNAEKSFTEKYQKHRPCGFCFQIVSEFEEFEPVRMRAKNENANVGEKFLEMLERFGKDSKFQRK